MFDYAIKSLYYKKILVCFIVLGMILSCLCTSLIRNIMKQIEENFYSQDKNYDLIIGANGSSTELVMASIFFTNEQLGTISYQVYEELENVIVKIPIAIADSYEGKGLYGTVPDYFNGITLYSGRIFDDEYELVIGSNFAEENQIKLGAKIVTSHGIGENISHSHEDTPYTVVGILNQTGTAMDGAIFTSIESIWHSHVANDGQEDSHEDGQEDDHDLMLSKVYNLENIDEMRGKLTAILIKTGNISTYNKIMSDINVSSDLQVVSVTNTLRNLMSNVGISFELINSLGYIIYVLCFVLIFLSLYLFTKNLSKDIICMKNIDIKEYRMFMYVFNQIVFILIVSAIGIILVRQGFLIYAKSIGKTFGIVLLESKMYVEEIQNLGIMFLLFLILTGLMIKKEIHR